MIVYGEQANGHCCHGCGNITSEIAHCTRLAKREIWLCSVDCMKRASQELLAGRLIMETDLSKRSVNRAVLIVADLVEYLKPEPEFPFDPIVLTQKIAAAIDAAVEEALRTGV
jgi:hypothetical protein